MKPEYLFKQDIDAVVVGVWHGKYQWFAEYLLALAHQPARGTDQPSRWVTFCKASNPLRGCLGECSLILPVNRLQRWDTHQH